MVCLSCNPEHAKNELDRAWEEEAGPQGRGPMWTHVLGHRQQHMRIMLTLLQGVYTLGLPLGSGLQEDSFRPQDT